MPKIQNRKETRIETKPEVNLGRAERRARSPRWSRRRQGQSVQVVLLVPLLHISSERILQHAQHQVRASQDAAAHQAHALSAAAALKGLDRR